MNRLKRVVFECRLLLSGGSYSLTGLFLHRYDNVEMIFINKIFLTALDLGKRPFFDHALFRTLKKSLYTNKDNTRCSKATPKKF